MEHEVEWFLAEFWDQCEDHHAYYLNPLEHALGIVNDKSLSLAEQLPSLEADEVDWGNAAIIASSDTYERLQEAWATVVNLPNIMQRYREIPQGDAIAERLSAEVETMGRSSARD